MYVVDLSMPLRSGMSVYPGDPNVAIDPALSIEGEGVAVSALSLGSHSGTHLDAPAHLIPGGPTLSEIPLEWLVGPAVVLRVRDPRDDARLGAADIEGGLPPTLPMIVCIATGWDALAGDERMFHHPYLSGELAAELWDRGARVLCVDTLSPDQTLPPGEVPPMPGPDAAGVDAVFAADADPTDAAAAADANAAAATDADAAADAADAGIADADAAHADAHAVCVDADADADAATANANADAGAADVGAAGAADAEAANADAAGVDAPVADVAAADVEAGSDNAVLAAAETQAAIPVHQFWLGRGGVIVENLVGLDRVPDEVELSLLPLPIADGDGAPIRAVAFLPSPEPDPYP